MNKIVIDACVWNHWYNPSEDVKHKLKDELGFHEATDLCYVNVALQADKVIITFDGDYGLFSIEYYRSVEDGLSKHRVAEYMSKELSLKVYLPQTYIKAC